MYKSVRGMWAIVFPKRGERRGLSWRYFMLLILVPVVAGVAWAFIDMENASLAMHGPAVIAASFGVFGGLLFAHAIFVFQLRISYDARLSGREGPDAPQVDLRVSALIDEMFFGVLYASMGALVLTLITTAVAVVIPAEAEVPWPLSAMIVGLSIHLGGSLIYVVNATTAAYSRLRE